jgi:neutral ceramidase
LKVPFHSRNTYGELLIRDAAILALSCITVLTLPRFLF